jgi:nucleotide-binding universal stress UspA family protein
MYKVIVVGTDGSDRAARAVREALSLAKVAGATLHVVHAVRPVTMMGADYAEPAAAAMAVADLRDHGDRVCAHVMADAESQNVPAQMHNVDGEPADVLIKLAEAVHADLVVIGNRGMTGIKRFVLGSVPNKVSHHCPCSLLIVDTDSP